MFFAILIAWNMPILRDSITGFKVILPSVGLLIPALCRRYTRTRSYHGGPPLRWTDYQYLHRPKHGWSHVCRWPDEEDAEDTEGSVCHPDVAAGALVGQSHLDIVRGICGVFSIRISVCRK
jgi:hypothetical protein